MRLVGELVLARNQLVRGSMRAPATRDPRCPQRPAAQPGHQRAAGERHEDPDAARSTHVWSKLPRVVRDLARTCGKQVRLEMEGKETELDRTLLEAVKDPLTHLVRNAVDHGIENAGGPRRRRQARRGRADAARVPRGRPGRTRGRRRRRRHRRRADRARRRSSGAWSAPTQLAAMDQRDIISLIFLPGFSTAAQGHQRLRPRRRHGRRQDQHRAHRRRGRRRLDARRGHDLAAHDPADAGDHPGADRRLRRPAVRRARRSPCSSWSSRRRARPPRIEYASGAPVYRLRGKLLPLVRLDEQLGLGWRPTSVGGDGEGVYIVVLQADGRRFGLVVDRS